MMIVLEIGMTKVELATKTGVETKINTKIKTNTGTEMTAMTKLEVGPKRDIANTM